MGSSIDSFYGTTQTGIAPESTEPPAVEAEPTTPFPELLEMLNTYNQELFENDQAGLSSLAATEQPGVIFSVSGQKGDMFGVLSIPKLDMEMLLYLGATNQHMADGAAQLGQTSIPVGVKNTNAVIAGHRGYNGRRNGSSVYGKDSLGNCPDGVSLHCPA